MGVFRQSGIIARNIASELSRQHADRDLKRKLIAQLQTRRVNVILDVGANSGQYASGIRKAGFKGRIISFEPLSGPFSELKKNSSGDLLWDCYRYALGDDDGTIAVNVAGNRGESSSVLPMLKRHQDAYPPANYVDMEEVPVRRLDSVLPELLQPEEVVFLKIDVQGFEKHVLAGSKSTLNHRCAGLQLELTFLPLYDGGMLIRESLELVSSLGFSLAWTLPCFMDPHDGQMLQADGIFFRDGS